MSEAKDLVKLHLGLWMVLGYFIFLGLSHRMAYPFEYQALEARGSTPLVVNIFFKSLFELTDKLMYILNDYTQNYPFCKLKLVFETNT